MYCCGRKMVLSQARVAVRLLYLRLEKCCRTYVFPANRNKMKSRRADSNRLPLLITSLLAYTLACTCASGNWLV